MRLRWAAVICLVVAGGNGAEGLAAPEITIEDLQDAEDRGDLSQSEFDLLAAMLLERLRDDSLELARLSESVVRLPVSRGPSPGAPRGRVRYSAYAPVRGSGATGQNLQIEPVVGACAARVLAFRAGSGPWYVIRASVSVAPGAFELQAGSLDLVWAGGLVVGRSPVLAGYSASGIAGLWKPGRSRLWGGRARMAGGPVDAEVLGSSVRDSVWQHQALGARIRVRFAKLWLEPAALGQRLTPRAGASVFAKPVWGLSAGSESRSRTIQVNSAVTGGALALQARLTGRAVAARWETEFWTVPQRFFHPLLHGRGEFDREPVDYPGLEAPLESASTGESGGRLSMRSGGSRSFGGISATVWREQPFRPASVRLSAAAQKTRGPTSMRVDFAHTSRPSHGSHEGRNDAGLRTGYRGVFAEIRGRWTWGNGLPFGAAGGRLAGGLRMQTASLGRWEVRASWDSYDLSLASGQFVTLRVDQSLPFRRGELGCHVRWRSAYATLPAVLSVHVDSSVFL